MPDVPVQHSPYDLRRDEQRSRATEGRRSEPLRAASEAPHEFTIELAGCLQPAWMPKKAKRHRSFPPTIEGRRIARSVLSTLAEVLHSIVSPFVDNRDL